MVTDECKTDQVDASNVPKSFQILQPNRYTLSPSIEINPQFHTAIAVFFTDVLIKALPTHLSYCN
jgi:hypothetical protein